MSSSRARNGKLARQKGATRDPGPAFRRRSRSARSGDRARGRGRGEASVAEVVEALRRSQRCEHAYTTIMTVMGRLHEKGVLTRERRGRQYIYRPTASEAELVDRLSGLAVDRLVDRYGTAALRPFAVRLADLDPKTRRRLAALADDQE